MNDWLFFAGGLGYTVVALPALWNKLHLPLSLSVGVLGMDVVFLIGYLNLNLVASSAITGAHMLVWMGLLGRAIRRM